MFVTSVVSSMQVLNTRLNVSAETVSVNTNNDPKKNVTGGALETDEKSVVDFGG